MLTTAGAAVAQIPEKVGDGIPSGQGGVQMFNYGGFLNDARTSSLGAASPITIARDECNTGGAAATTDDCRWYRLELLFGYLKSKGVTNIELFGHSAFPDLNTNEIEGEYGFKAYRALMDKYGIHAGGWHGSMNEAPFGTRLAAAKILGADYIGSGGVAGDNLNIDTYDGVLRSAQALNRLGKRAVEGGVGPVYIHNHTGEFDRKYVDNGVEKYAYDIIMERTDPRYVVGELDVFWSSDAFNDVSGDASAAFINKWGSRIQLMHVKDGINIAGQPSPTNSRSGLPRATGTGELDFRPIFAAAKGKIRYYHQEHDSGTLTDMATSLTNLQARGTSIVGTVHANPPSFASVPAGTAAAANVTPVLVENTGAAPLAITNIQVQSIPGGAADGGDFAIVSQNCNGATLAPGDATNPRGTCVVNVGFKPTKTNYTSVARLAINSSSDAATETTLLAATSTGDAIGTIGGDVPSVLQLNVVNAGGSFGTFVPGLAASYQTALAATATATTGNATLSVTDPAAGTSGYLVNGERKLATPLDARALGLGDTTAFAPLNTDGTAKTLKTWDGPFTAAPLTLGFRQAITNTEPLRAGTYSKTLTFTLSTTTP